MLLKLLLLAGLAAAQTNAPIHGVATAYQQRDCTVSCELKAKNSTVTTDGVAEIVTRLLISVNHDVTSGHTHHMCYKIGCGATDSLGCGCGCDCSDDGVNFFGSTLDNAHHVAQVMQGLKQTAQYHYSHTVCDATSTIVTLPGNATLDNACACASGYHTKISTTANGIVTESCTAHTICGDNTVESSAGTATADASCACASGHHSKTGTTTETCEINVCDCPNGNAVANTACTLDGATQCASCTAATHHLVGTSCVACNWVDITAVLQTGSNSQCIGSISDLAQCEIFAATIGYASVHNWAEGGNTGWPEGCIINGGAAYWQGLTQTSDIVWADNGGYKNDGGFICSTPGTLCSYSASASTGQQFQTDGCGATQVTSGCDAGCSWDNTAPPVQTDSQCIGSIRTESECSGAAAELGVSYKMVAPSEFNQGCFIHDGEAYWQPNVQTGSNPSAPGGWGANVFEGYICPSAGLQTCASAGQQHQQSNTCGWRKVSSTASPCVQSCSANPKIQNGQFSADVDFSVGQQSRSSRNERDTNCDATSHLQTQSENRVYGGYDTCTWESPWHSFDSANYELPSSITIEYNHKEDNGQNSGSHTRLEIRFKDANGNYLVGPDYVTRPGDFWEEVEQITGDQTDYWQTATTRAHTTPASAVEYQIRAEVEVKDGQNWWADDRDRRYLDDIKVMGQC